MVYNFITSIFSKQCFIFKIGISATNKSDFRFFKIGQNMEYLDFFPSSYYADIR